MTFIDAKSNRSRITCIMVVAESDWMRIQNLPNRIGCGVKKSRVRAPLVSRSVASHEAKAKLKIACLDSNSNFAVFTKSKFLPVSKTKHLANKQTLLNRRNFVLQHTSKTCCSASKPCRIFNNNWIGFENFFRKHAFNRRFCMRVSRSACVFTQFFFTEFNSKTKHVWKALVRELTQIVKNLGQRKFARSFRF